MSTPHERYDQLLRAYLVEPDPDKSDAILKEVLAAGRRVDEGPAPQPTMADLVRAEQARARRRHPNDHAGHEAQTNVDRLNILRDELHEVAMEVAIVGTDEALAHELLQVAGVALSWLERIMADRGITTADLLAIIEGDSE